MNVINRKCETCKRFFKKNQDDENICGDCSKVRSIPAYSNWEWNGIESGCDFCNGKSGKIEVKHGKAGVSMVSTIQNKHLVTAARLSCDEKYLQDFEINYCPMCGKRL